MFQSKEPLQSEPITSPSTDCPTPTVSYVLLAQILRVKVDTLHGYVKRGQIRQPTYFGKLARWTRATVDLIIAEGTRPPGTYPHVRPARPKRPRSKSSKKPPAQPSPATKPTATIPLPSLASTVHLRKGRKR